MTAYLSIMSGLPAVNTGWIREHKGTLNPLKELEGKFCPCPFNELQINDDGQATVCCPNWLPRPIGTIGKTGIMGVWNSAAAQKIRRSILDGSFTYCDQRVCPEIQSGNLPEYKDLPAEYREIVDQKKTFIDHLPGLIGFNYDRSCNLSCPSCRTEKTIFSKGSRQYEESKSLTDLVMAELAGAGRNRPIILNIIGSGDPFVSPVFRGLLETFDGARFPNITIDLQTNGTLFTEGAWEALHKIHQNIRHIFISIDAATPGTYAAIRRGGNWRQLMSNLEVHAKLRRGNELRSIQFVFVVQQRNFREMPLFVKSFLGTLCDSVKFSFLNDWGTWKSKALYEQQCIWKGTHPEFQDFLRVLRDPVFNNSMVLMGNVSAYREIALRQAAAGGSARPPLPLVKRYLQTNDPGLFRLSFLCNPVFMANRLLTLRSWRDLYCRAGNILRLIAQKVLKYSAT